jgi:hypothetical protein
MHAADEASWGAFWTAFTSVHGAFQGLSAQFRNLIHEGMSVILHCRKKVHHPVRSFFTSIHTRDTPPRLQWKKVYKFLWQEFDLHHQFLGTVNTYLQGFFLAFPVSFWACNISALLPGFEVLKVKKKLRYLYTQLILANCWFYAQIAWF